ncbi:MAG: hypothetical protein P4L40_00330 [Terracidiphilus sp.]|nr:hypothetical protein [Terracidiphilus sp.]
MELFLNSVWALLGLLLFALWLRTSRREQNGRVEPLLALAMLVVLLFPVISVTDDLWAIQNPAESDTSIRRDLNHAVHQGIFPVAMLPALAAALPALHRVHSVEPQHAAVSPASCVLPRALDNRPPPAA